jgi:hypothetical protein
MKTKGSALITQAISSKDTTSSSIQQQRLGVGNDSYINAKLESLKKAYRDSLLGSGSSTSSTNGKRRKREVSSSSPLTCNSLYSLSVIFYNFISNCCLHFSLTCGLKHYFNYNVLAFFLNKISSIF